MVTKMKKIILFSLLHLLNYAILRCYGWKKQIQIHTVKGVIVSSCIVWKDPEEDGIYHSKKDAIVICEERIK